MKNCKFYNSQDDFKKQSDKKGALVAVGEAKSGSGKASSDKEPQTKPSTLVKTIVKPKYVTGIYNAHRFVYRYGYHPIDVQHNQVDGHNNNPDPKVLQGD